MLVATWLCWYIPKIGAMGITTAIVTFAAKKAVKPIVKSL